MIFRVFITVSSGTEIIKIINGNTRKLYNRKQSCTFFIKTQCTEYVEAITESISGSSWTLALFPNPAMPLGLEAFAGFGKNAQQLCQFNINKNNILRKNPLLVYNFEKQFEFFYLRACLITLVMWCQ